MNVKHQTVLRFQDSKSNKVWAYDHDTQTIYYGRFGNHLATASVDSTKVDARITSKLKKGYIDYSDQYYIENETIHSLQLEQEKTTNWTISFESLTPENDLYSHLDAIKVSLFPFNEFDESSLSEAENYLKNYKENGVKAVTFDPLTDILKVFTSLKTEFPDIDIVDNFGNLVTRDLLLSTIKLSKKDLVSWLITQEIKVFKQQASEIDDAYF